MFGNWLPYWVRIVLSILSVLSFTPQLQRIFTSKDSTGVSHYYALFNLVSATEQFMFGLIYIVESNQPGNFIDEPRSLGDWLNLVQFAVVWLMFLLLFAACLYYLSRSRAGVIALYALFLLVSLVPVILQIITGDLAMDRGDFGWIFGGLHIMMIGPIVTILGLCALFAQMRHMAHGGALSIVGLAVQAFIFFAVALSWLVRIYFPVSIEFDRINLHFLLDWYRFMGWAAVDNIVFAFVQFVLLCLATKGSRRARRVDETLSPGEQEPLLGGQ